MDLKILGITGSPVKEGNVEVFLEKMMGAVSKKPGVEIETLNLSTLDIQDCTHCNFCIRKQKPDKYCALKDDGQMLFEKIEAADIIVLASPVYFLRTSARMAAMIDRLRVFVFGNEASGKLKNKVGVSAAVSWARNAGLETTHLTHLYAFLTLEMVPVSVHHCVSPLGASAVASPMGSGIFDKSIRHGVETDNMGLHSGSAMMNRAIELATLLKKGAEK